MRRCDRHPSRENDPYLEFSFEKSLRKYEAGPHKRIKNDTQSLTKTITNIPQGTQRDHGRVNINSQKQVFRELPQVSNTQELIVQEQLKQQNAKERHNDGSIQQAKQAQMSLMKENLGQINEDESLLKHQDPQKQNQHFEVNQGQKGQNYKIVSETFNSVEKALIQEKQLINIHQEVNNSNQPSLQILNSFEKEQVQKQNQGVAEKNKIYMQKQGRLNLTDKISVSLRSIKKCKQNGISNKDIVEQLLKRMNFTKEETVQISDKLEKFLELNQ